MPSGRRHEHAQYATSLNIYFRPRQPCSRASRILTSLISEVIVRGERNIKQNRNCFYFNFSVEIASFIFHNFKTEKFKLTFKG